MHWNICDMVTTFDLPWPKNTAHSWVADQLDEPPTILLIRQLLQLQKMRVNFHPHALQKNPHRLRLFLRSENSRVFNARGCDGISVGRPMEDAFSHECPHAHTQPEPPTHSIARVCFFVPKRGPPIKGSVCRDTRVVMLKQRQSSMLCCWPACCHQ